MRAKEQPQPVELSEEVLTGPTDEFGIPLAVEHGPQTGLPVWQFIHELETPLVNANNPHRPYTHVCILCAADPQPRRSGITKPVTWRRALMRQRMSTNAVSHLKSTHPDEFAALGEMKQQRKREREAARAASKSKRSKIPGVTKKIAAKAPLAVEKDQESGAKPESSQRARTRVTVGMRQRAENRRVLLSHWLISAGLPHSALQNHELRTLLALPPQPVSTALAEEPTLQEVHNCVQTEFAQFSAFLAAYLSTESQLALGLPFLSLRYELRPATETVDAEDTSLQSDERVQQRAFLGVSASFIDSQWRPVDLALVAKHVTLLWDQEPSDVATTAIAETHGVREMAQYTRFHVATDVSLALSTSTVSNETIVDEQEDLLTRTLRRCVVDALELAPMTVASRETTGRRVLRLLQELLTFFEVTSRRDALQQLCDLHGVSTTLASASTMDNLTRTTTTSLGDVAELLRLSCAHFRGYRLYFSSSTRPTVNKPELEGAWSQLSAEDWSTVTEMEALLHQLGQFRLEECVANGACAVTPSYALLFRRLLSVTTNLSSFKCLALEEEPSARGVPRRKAKWVDSFTTAGQQCLARFRHNVNQLFPEPSGPAEDDEIKAMLLDPRISSKAASLVTDARALRRAEDALRHEHRIVFEELAVREAENPEAAQLESDEDTDDDEMSALLMVDAPKQQPPPSNRRSSLARGPTRELVAEGETRAWREWQQAFVAWDTLADEGADLFAKGGQYNLLKLYHHVNILQWFHDVGEKAYPAAALLARIYLGQQPPSSPTLGASLARFTQQEASNGLVQATQRAGKRAVLHHNWRQYQELHATSRAASADGAAVTESI